MTDERPTPTPAPLGRDERNGPRWGRWLTQLGVVVVAGLALYVVLLAWGDGARLSRALEALRPRAMLAIGAWVVLGLGLRAVRWQLYTRWLGLDLPPVANQVAFLASFSFTATPGKVGEVLKGVLLKRRFGAAVSLTTGSLLIERLFDLLAVAILASWALLDLEQGRALYALVLLVLLAVSVFLLRRQLQERLLALLARNARWNRPRDWLAELLAGSRALLQPSRFLIGLLLALGAWSCEGLAFARVLLELDAGLPTPMAMAIFALATLFGVASLLPGGLGGFEAAMIFSLVRLGLGQEQAVVATLVIRLMTLWLVSALGFAFLGVWTLVYGRRGPLATRQ